MILLNFIIALITQSYENVMTTELEIKYKQRTQLNREACLILNRLGFEQIKLSMFLLTANSEGKKNTNIEW